MSRILKYRVGRPFPVFPYKDPNSILDYSFSWQNYEYPWLSENETLVGSEWYIDDILAMSATELTEENSAIVDNINSVVWLSGGVTGTRYKLTNRVTTSEGRIEDRSAYIQIQEL